MTVAITNVHEMYTAYNPKYKDFSGEWWESGTQDVYITGDTFEQVFQVLVEDYYGERDYKEHLRNLMENYNDSGLVFNFVQDDENGCKIVDVVFEVVQVSEFDFEKEVLQKGLTVQTPYGIIIV